LDLHLAHLCRFAVRAPTDLPRSFSRQCELDAFALSRGLPITPQSTGVRICLHSLPWGLDLVCHHQAHLPSCVPPSVLTVSRWGRNINRLCITYAFRPRLSSRLTLGRRALPRKPRLSVGGILTLLFATHAGILTSASSSGPSGPPSPYSGTLPTALPIRR